MHLLAAQNVSADPAQPMKFDVRRRLAVGPQSVLFWSKDKINKYAFIM
jgi:hypothetical protein